MNITKRFTAFLLSLLVVALVGCAGSATKEGTGEYIDDTVITGKIKAELIKDPQLKATEINVETFKGTVQLSGFVKTPDDAAKAVAVARNVKGVQSVKNDIRLK